MHEKLAVWTRVAAVLAAVAIGALLFTIKSDLAAISLGLVSKPVESLVSHQPASMQSLKACLCSPTRGTITIVTTRGRDESIAEADARHLADIAAWKAQVTDAVDCPCPD